MRSSKNSRIIGGETADPLEFPWIGSIKSSSSQILGKHQCAVSLINEEWAVTAAHCGSHNRIVFGEHYLNVTEGTEREFEIEEVIYDS
jgi:secreted trypsin-like serine protease